MSHKSNKEIHNIDYFDSVQHRVLFNLVALMIPREISITTAIVRWLQDELCKFNI